MTCLKCMLKCVEMRVRPTEESVGSHYRDAGGCRRRRRRCRVYSTVVNSGVKCGGVVKGWPSVMKSHCFAFSEHEIRSERVERAAEDDVTTARIVWPAAWRRRQGRAREKGRRISELVRAKGLKSEKNLYKYQ